MATADKIVEDSLFFDHMMSKIPASYYYPVNTNEEQGPNKFAQHTKKDVTAVENKHLKKVNQKNKKMNKKFDPKTLASALDVQRQTYEQKAASGSAKLKRNGQLPTGAPSAGLEELKAKLAAKRSTFQSHLVSTNPKKLTRKKTPAAKDSKSTKKESKKDKKGPTKGNKNKGGEGEEPSGEEPSAKKQKVEDSDGEEEVPEKLVSGQKRDKHKKADSEFTDLMFGAVKDISDQVSGTGAGSHSRKEKKNKTKKELLKQALKFEAQVDDIRAVDNDAAEKMVHNKAVEAALLRAQGIKVKDDPKLLKKSLRKAQASKKKSQREWAGRVKEVKTDMATRLDKRTANVKAYTDKKKGIVPKSDKPSKNERRKPGEGNKVDM